MEGHPLAEEIRGQAAVQRGPLVYCLESSDLPAGVRPADVAVRPTDRLQAHHLKDLLGGITVLEGRGYVIQGQPWGQNLYRPISPKEPKPIGIRLIPYYAWGNRGDSEMCVWLPVR